jgi:hypothetical protein
MITVYDGNKCAGFVEMKSAGVLSQIHAAFQVQLDCFAHNSETNANTYFGGHPKNTEIFLNLYGCRDYSERIAALLEENDMFLQHPQNRNTAVEYFNPHYLSYPGEKAAGNRNYTDYANTNLAGTEKSRIVQVFDSADGPDHFSEAKISGNLLTPLKVSVLDL